MSIKTTRTRIFLSFTSVALATGQCLAEVEHQGNLIINKFMVIELSSLESAIGKI
jgi:hypothetical protein